MPIIDVKPLEFALIDKIGVKTHTAKISWGSYEFCTGWANGKTSLHVNGHFSETTWHDNPELAKAAANAHYAAQVRSQMAEVRLSDDEARKMAATLSQCQCETIEDMALAVQAAIAAMQVDADPAPGNGDDDGE